MASVHAREMRRNPTDAERALWARLRHKQLDGLRFRRQQPMVPYIVDFFCPECALIIEIDGGQHAMPEAQDAARTRWLEARGYRVLRFWNNEVLENIEGVLETIRKAARG
ncbi:MAG: endonuclease domain-containing protein [Stellaceae bacterium]